MFCALLLGRPLTVQVCVLSHYPDSRLPLLPTEEEKANPHTQEYHDEAGTASLLLNLSMLPAREPPTAYSCGKVKKLCGLLLEDC